MVIAVANTKGGVGKSTLSMHLIRSFQIIFPEKKVLLLDSDTQGTCINWARWRAEKDIEPFVDVQIISQDGFNNFLKARASQYDIVVIDVGGSDNPNLRRALLKSSAVIIPCSLDPAERIHVFDIIKLINDVKDEFNPSLETIISFNKVKNAVDKNSLNGFKNNFPSYIHWLNSVIMHRVAIARVYGYAKTVFDLDKKEEDPKALTEFLNLTQEVVEILGIE